jgi:hypothetical protein
MKNVRWFHLLALCCLAVLHSCEGNQTVNNPVPKQESPKALQENNLEIKTYSRNSNLAEELYQGLLEKDEALKKLESDISALEPRANELVGDFDRYQSKSNSYYEGANVHTRTIADTALKNRIDALLSKSQARSSMKAAALHALMKEMKQRDGTLKDHHTVLKIVLTLPIIEKYQNQNLPSQVPFKDFIKSQDAIIGKTDSLTPKF